MARKPIPCKVCGNLYPGQGKKCKDCHLKEMKEKRLISLTCPTCGKYKHRESYTCRDCYIKKHVKPENYFEKICPSCKESFVVHKTHLDRGQGKYCSRSCARSGSPTKPITSILLKCYVCSKNFRKHQSEIRKNLGNLNFCSPDCWYEFNQGANHPVWDGGHTPERQAFYSSKEWRKVIPKVWRRDNAQCQRCKISKNDTSKKFHIHHLISFKVKKYRAELDNLILLCADCHHWVHSNANKNSDFKIQEKDIDILEDLIERVKS